MQRTLCSLYVGLAKHKPGGKAQETRANQGDSFSALPGFGAFRKYYRDKILRWEGGFQVSVPSACFFLGGLEGRGEILVLFKLVRTFPQLQ